MQANGRIGRPTDTIWLPVAPGEICILADVFSLCLRR